MVEELEEFKVEILELLESAERALMAFEELPENQSSESLYNEVFRSYHNIKGAAGMLEWKELMDHVHQLETVLMQTKATSSIPKNYIGWFLKGNDAARAIMAGGTYNFSYELPSTTTTTLGQKPSEDVPAEFFAEVSEAMENVSNLIMKIEAGESNKDIIDSIYRSIHTVKGAADLFEFSLTSKLAHAMESGLEEARKTGATQLDPQLLSILLESVDLINQSVRDYSKSSLIQEVNAKISLLESLSKQVQVTQVQEIKQNKNEQEDNEVKSSVEHKEVTDTTIRVQVSLLDKLMTLMGEMVLVRNQVLQYTEQCDNMEFTRLGQRLNQVTSELQEETMKTRMQPIGNILNKFQRMVRDLSTSLDKKIQLKLIGTETELDKSLLEAVKDPLTHIVRNSCDHGLETSAERLRSGKNETGLITIEAYHEGGQVVVEISDDGRGLQQEKILNKAIERGIITNSQASALSSRDIFNLIFMPGFSTAQQISNVSGRGVGMDVVKSNIQKIGGFVEVSSTEGKGTKITLKIPLTLAIVPALIVKADGDSYAIPQVKLVELIRVSRRALEIIHGKNFYRLRGNLLPIINIYEVFENNLDVNYHEQDEINVVVLHSQGQFFGLAVDEIVDTYDIVVKPLAKFLSSLSIYSGATVLGDGSVAFILDILGIAQKCLAQEGRENENRKELVEGSNYDDSEIKEYVLIDLGVKTKYAISSSMVKRLEEYRSDAFEYSGTQKVLRYRGQILPIISLANVLGNHYSADENDTVSVIVVSMNDQLFGIEVFKTIDIFSTQAYLDKSFVSHRCIEGNLIEENEIIVVINLETVVDEYRSEYRKLSQSADRSIKKILLVEDTESIRTKTCDVLMDAGYEVVCAVDGVDGLKKLAENKLQFDLIVSDIEMPRMNGYEFTAKVRTIDRMKKIPVIAFTTKNSESDLKLAKDSGFTSFLEKSKLKLLSNLVDECLRDSSRRVA